MKRNSIFLLLTYILISCNNNENSFDASGTFEAVETIISADANGQIKELSIEEGQILKPNQYVGYIDSTQLYLRKTQLEAQINALLQKKPNIGIQLASLNNQLNKSKREKNRLVNLLKDGAATPKQIDDIDAEIEVLKNQIKAQESTLNITSSGINKDVIPLTIQISQINDQLEKSKIINPLSGSVLVKYVERNEMVTIGKPMYKIADLSEIILRAYITGNQLPNIKINQKVKVYIDSINGEYKETTGVITWISDKAEFTPKTIQTKDERANLVYAIKIKVINDGSYKIGMYGEIKF